MSTITKIELNLGYNTTTTWIEIDPSTISNRHANDNIRHMAKKIWADARETRSLVDIHNGYKACTVTVTTKTCFGLSKETFSI
jgi:hypothetical protein